MSSPPPDFQTETVKAAFDAFADLERRQLLYLRTRIFEIAAHTPQVGALEETLKWGQPAYLTPETRSGTTIRLGQAKSGGAALYVHCQTTIIAEFAAEFSAGFGQGMDVEGNRAVHFAAGTDIPDVPLHRLIRRALTYHVKPSKR